MSKIKTDDIIGMTFDRLTVLSEDNIRSTKGEIRVLCECSCGNRLIIPRTRIINRKTKSCGCLRDETSRISRPLKYLRVNIDILEPLTDDVAYFLGFFFADGNINRKVARIDIQRRDEYLLKEFVETIQINNPVMRKSPTYLYKGEKRSSLSSSLIIYDKGFVNFLENYGITPNKTFTLKFPTNIQEHLVRHFVRGYWDGDGTINISKRVGIRDMNIAVCSASKPFIESLRSWLEDNSVRCGQFYSANNAHTFRVSTKNNNVHNFYKLLYSDENICLERKRRSLEEILDYLRSSKKSVYSRTIGELL